MKKFLLFNTFIVCGLNFSSFAATYECRVQEISPFSFKVSNEFLFPTFGDFKDANGRALVCGHRGTKGCDSGAKVMINSEHYWRNERHEAIGVYTCSTSGSNAWSKSNLDYISNCKDTNGKQKFITSGDYDYYCEAVFDNYCVGATATGICKVNTKKTSNANTTNTSPQSTTKVSNTKNSNQTAQKNNTSSNKPAPSQQQAIVEEYECDQEKLQQLVRWKITYATNQKILAAIKQLEDYCEGKNKQPDDFNTMYQTLSEMIDKLEEENALQKQKEQEAAKQAANEKEQQQSRTKITSTIKILDDISGRFELSVWKDEDGNFNTARLVSDSVAGVVLGTAGGLITSNVVKKNQVESGFEDIKCTVGGQVVADWGDQFRVGIR